MWSLSSYSEESGEEASRRTEEGGRGGGASVELAAAQRADHGEAAEASDGARCRAGSLPARRQGQEEETGAQCTGSDGWDILLDFVLASVLYKL